MKWRYPLLLLSVLLIASSASWADTVIVGSLDLINNGTTDTLLLSNITGQTPVPTNTVAEAEPFASLSLFVNGSQVSINPALEPVAANGGAIDFGDLFPLNSITTLTLNGSLTGPTTVTVNGVQVPIVPSFVVTYSGTALADGAHFDVLAQTVSAPEPAVIPLFGMAVWFLRRRITG